MPQMSDILRHFGVAASHSPQERSVQLSGGYTTIGLHLWFVVASLPVAIFAFARQSAEPNSVGVLAAIVFLLASLGTSYGWHLLFARSRGRAMDPAWFMHAWLFCLLVPVSTSLPLVITGVSFGVVVGSLIFGGTGRYVVSPALLGALLLELSFPGTLDGALSQSTWDQLVGAQGQSEASWWSVTVHQQTGGMGTSSAAACAFGALVLWCVGAISGRVVVGGLVGVVIASMLVSLGELNAIASLPYYWHWILGSLPFCLAFIVTDPTISAATAPGRWLYGGLFGVLVVVLRVCDPNHPEGTLIAGLLACLFVPLIDQCCVRVALARWHRRKSHFQR